MILLTKVAISGFRSFFNDELVELGNLNVLVGKNSSGKSNVLRALNLFFNNEVQPGQELSFARDLFDSGQRRKKQMSITVEFSLPPTFVLRKKLETSHYFGTTVLHNENMGTQRPTQHC